MRKVENKCVSRDNGYPLKLMCACFYDCFEKSWSQEWKDRYNSILQRSDHIVFICQHYSKACFQIRNKWMVNHSTRVIAVFNGEKGGTNNTIDYAKKQGKDLILIKS